MIRELDGVAAPPMQNGELLFEAPWQGRVFGIAHGLAERGVFAWEEFRQRLIVQIGAFDRGLTAADLVGTATAQFRYYDHFLRALESLLVDRALIAPGELVARVDAFADRPHGHDHHDHHDHHGHDHDHD
jgi:nitrile hydratase accessory protein